MPIPLPGALVFEYKQVTVTKDDITVNTEIETQANDNWFVSMMQVDGANMIILFGRVAEIAPA